MALASRQMGIYTREKDLALGLDPGRDKTGFAFVNFDGELLLSGIFPSNETEKFFDDFTPYIVERKIDFSAEEIISQVKFIAVGNGTTSRDFTEKLRTITGHEIITVDEKNTTIEARNIYWKIHRPGIFLRFLPEGMRVPPRVVDDLAAFAVALRGLKKYRDIRRNKL